MIIGDDFAYGVGDEHKFYETPGIARYLAQLLQKSHVRQTWDIYNFGIPGTTSFSWLPCDKSNNYEKTNFDKVFNSKYNQHVQIVIILLGFSDGRQQIEPQVTFENLQKITDTLVRMGISYYVCPVANHADHLAAMQDWDLYHNNTVLNDLIIESSLTKGPLINNLNFEYKGEFLYAKDKQHFNRKGYIKLSKDLLDSLENHMIRVEFKKFKQKLGT
jgi:lysophospholipase L1-like esterase